jgi:hypothetical protein
MTCRASASVDSEAPASAIGRSLALCKLRPTPPNTAHARLIARQRVLITFPIPYTSLKVAVFGRIPSGNPMVASGFYARCRFDPIRNVWVPLLPCDHDAVQGAIVLRNASLSDLNGLYP